MNATFRFVATLAVCSLLSCSSDPIGALYTIEDPPFTEQVGPYLRITFNPGPDRYPSWSSDGESIVYSAYGFEKNTLGHSTVNIIPATGGVSRRISPAYGRVDTNVYPHWFENDRKVAYISFRRLGGIHLVPTLALVDVNDMSEWQEKALGFNDPLDMDVSPDGTTVVYSDYPSMEWYHPDSMRVYGEEIIYTGEESASYAITYMCASPLPPSGETRKIPGADGARGISWCPTADCIAFSKDGLIYTITSQGSVPVPLCEGNDPCWSPDGQKIACTLDGNIFIYDIDSGERSQVTTEGGTDPSWSPDARKLAFSWVRDEWMWNYDLYIAELEEWIFPPERRGEVAPAHELREVPVSR
jgi:hypothetical protein